MSDAGSANAHVRFHGGVLMRAYFSRCLPRQRAGRSGQGGAGRAGRVRLTRRGRVVAWALALGLFAAVLAGVLVIGPAVNAAPDAGEPVEVVVQPGDTLWSVARRHDPTEDPLVIAEEIRKLNGLPDYTVHPGQTLKLP